ncbi:peroxidasin homolog [Stylophora pistillata]|uniref:peroxidasin homolog n=1 Tax=Stylophora pistillata TaxID=50429 RepID=UPI000C03BB06|nr:peroxidasin homolog [Stylophora pistillata]XP_022793793.1 peroxidasin homolog [Stylophora pistillata]
MPNILVHPNNVSIYLEETTVKAIFFCKASGIPLPSISWLKNNSTLIGGMVTQNGSSSSLLIQRVAKEEKFARFKCIAKNPFGEVSSQEGVLVVREQAQDSGIGQRPFYLQPKSVKAIAGDSVVFVCAMEGSPVPNIMWLKDGTTNVDGSIDYYPGEQSATSVLRIYPVSERHVGRYSCEAVTTISWEAVLTITGKESSRSSLCISNAVWIPVVTGAVLLLFMVISIFFIHHRNKNAKFSIEKKMRENNQFSHLHTGDDMISQQRGDITAPRYQMTNLAFTTSTKF